MTALAGSDPIEIAYDDGGSGPVPRGRWSRPSGRVSGWPNRCVTVSSGRHATEFEIAGAHLVGSVSGLSAVR
jgi:hypothetical protein